MTEPVDTRLIAAHLSAALISSGAEMTGHPVTDAVRIYSEVLQALKEAEKLDQTERMGKVLDSLGNEPPGG